jgi:hypothetical protein
MMLSAVTWTGGGGSDHAWSNPANWSSGVPGAADDVTIGLGAIASITDNVTVQNLTNNGTIEMGGLSGKTLTVSGSFVNAGTFQYDGGDYNGYVIAAMQNTGTIHVTQGFLAIDLAGNTTSGWNSVSSPYTFTNTGTIRLDGAECSIGGMLTPNDLGSSLTGTGYLKIVKDAWTLNANWTLPTTTITLFLESSTITGTGDLIIPTQDALVLFNSTVSVDIVDQGILLGWTGGTVHGNVNVASSAVLAVGVATLGFQYPDSAPPSSTTLSLTIDGDLTNDGTVNLYSTYAGSTLTVSGALSNKADGTVYSLAGFESQNVANALNATVDNQGTLKVTGSDLAVNKGMGTSLFTLTNGANRTIDVGAGRTLTIGGASVANNGLIKMGGNATVDFAAPTVRIDGQGALQGQSTSTVHVRGSLLGNTTNAAGFDQPGIVILDGNGTALSPQLLELMQQDQANAAAGYAGNVAYGTLTLGSGTYVKLVDQSNNAPGADAEAGYATSLIVPAGSTLNKNNLRFYAGNAARPEATVSLNTSAPKTGDLLTATAAKSDADGDPVALTFRWKVNGVVKQTTSSASALTDSFSLAGLLGGDVVTIEVTPNDGSRDGIAATASVIVSSKFGPTIRNIAIAGTQNTITWNALDADGMASSLLAIDGVAIASVSGSDAAASGVNYTGVFGSLATGSHTYEIRATDAVGDTSIATGTFSVTSSTNTPPVIGGIMPVPAKGLITWNVLDGDGVARSALAIDGTAVSQVYGPWVATSGVNYSGALGTLAAGSHNYVITAIDCTGSIATSTGTFEVSAQSGPAISDVSVVASDGLMTWNVVDAQGVASSTLTLNGAAIAAVYGPYRAASGVNYAGVFGRLTAGTYSYVITAVNGAGVTRTATDTFTVTAENTGCPTIRDDTVVAIAGVITWNAFDPDGIASTSLTVDGVAVAKVYGPYAAASGANYGGVFGSLTAGDHNYVIAATDGMGNTTLKTGVFTTSAGPTIRNVDSFLAADGVMTWNAVDASGIASTTLTIDGAAISNVYGPYQAASGVNFAGVFGILPTGTYHYVITAVNNAGFSSTTASTFTVAASAASGPTISNITVVPAEGVVTWNAFDSDGIASTSLTIDGIVTANLYGPYAAASGFNYGGLFGALAVGTHTYAIAATDRAGHTSIAIGEFNTTLQPISSILVAEADGDRRDGVLIPSEPLVISWKTTVNGIVSVVLRIDDMAVTPLYGPYRATVGVHYSASIGTRPAGRHTYTITVIDKVGSLTKYSGEFDVTAVDAVFADLGAAA